MKFKITYTTNLDDRRIAFIEGTTKTEAYLTFIRLNPIHYIIVEMEEMP